MNAVLNPERIPQCPQGTRRSAATEFPGVVAFGRQPERYGGEWLPSNAGAYVDSPKAPQAPQAPPPATAGRSSTANAAAPPRVTSRRGLFAGIAATALFAGTGGAVAGGLATAAVVQRRVLPLPAIAPAPIVTLSN